MLGGRTRSLPLLSGLNTWVYQQPATICYRHGGTIGAHTTVAPIPLHRRFFHYWRAVLSTPPNDAGRCLDMGQRIRCPLSTSSVGCRGLPDYPAPKECRHRQALSVRSTPLFTTPPTSLRPLTETMMNSSTQSVPFSNTLAVTRLNFTSSLRTCLIPIIGAPSDSG